MVCLPGEGEARAKRAEGVTGASGGNRPPPNPLPHREGEPIPALPARACSGPLLRVRWLGRLPYLEAWDLQRALWEGRVEGRTPDDYLLLLEHPHVYTVGRNGDGSNLLVPEESLQSLGAEVHRVDRGGDVTYHGPGQLVGYPIVGLTDPKQIVPHVRRIEQALVAALSDLGVSAWTEPGYTGVWTDDGKVAAIGVRVSRGVSIHGFALNVDPDLGLLRAHAPVRDLRSSRHLTPFAVRSPRLARGGHRSGRPPIRRGFRVRTPRGPARRLYPGTGSRSPIRGGSTSRCRDLLTGAEVGGAGTDRGSSPR